MRRCELRCVLTVGWEEGHQLRRRSVQPVQGSRSAAGQGATAKVRVGAHSYTGLARGAPRRGGPGGESQPAERRRGLYGSGFVGCYDVDDDQSRFAQGLLGDLHSQPDAPRQPDSSPRPRKSPGSGTHPLGTPDGAQDARPSVPRLTRPGAVGRPTTLTPPHLTGSPMFSARRLATVLVCPLLTLSAAACTPSTPHQDAKPPSAKPSASSEGKDSTLRLSDAIGRLKVARES